MIQNFYIGINHVSVSANLLLDTKEIILLTIACHLVKILLNIITLILEFVKAHVMMELLGVTVQACIKPVNLSPRPHLIIWTQLISEESRFWL